MPAMLRTALSASFLLFAVTAGHAVLDADVASPPPAADAGGARQDLPEGPGKAEVERMCVGCHDLASSVSVREDEAGWTRIVNDMRAKGTDGTEEEFAKIIAYLTKNMGKPKS